MGKMREPRLRDDEGREIELETGERREAPPKFKRVQGWIDPWEAWRSVSCETED